MKLNRCGLGTMKHELLSRTEFMESIFIVVAVICHKGAPLSWYGDLHTYRFHWNLKRLFRKPPPYISTDILSSKNTDAHQLKLDII